MRIDSGWRIALMVLGAIWLFMAGVIGLFAVTHDFPTRFQYSYQLREGAALKLEDKELPLYDLVRSPSAEKLPVEFVRRGYQGVPNLRNHEGRMQEWVFPDQTILYLSPNLSEADRQYIKDAFQAHSGARERAWNRAIMSWLGIFLLPPLFVFGLIYLGRLFRFPEVQDGPR